nr:hypothetical protein [Micromonospora terminaliae]
MATQEPPGRLNGHHVNGVHHAGEEPPVTRQAPVSAPPADEPRRDTDADRLVVPAQRPAPAVEQPAAEADPAGSRHASDDSPAGRAARWADSGPTSGPPALQVPPVGAAASGFEVPPGFHAPTAERSEPPSLSRGWADRRPPEQPPAEATPPAGHADRFPPEQPPAQAPSLSRGWADRPTSAPPAGPDTGAGEERRPVAEQPRAAADDRGAGPAEEPAWSGPAWNRPSWGGGWAPPWGRADDSPGRRAGEDEPTGRRAAREEEPVTRRAAREDEPAGRRAAREDEPVARRAAREDWAAEASRPYEPARVEPPAGYDPRPEPVHPYEPVRTEAPAGYEAPRPEPSRPYEEPRPAPEPAARAAPERPSWAAPPVPVTPFSAPPHTTPTSAPPVPREAPTGYPPVPAVRAAEEREGSPYRLPGGSDPAVPAGPPPAPVDRIPAPVPASAPPYAARRSAPEPPPAAEAVADDPTPVLPQRVPAEPDVPVVPEPPAVEPSAETPELARIATHLRRDDEPAPLRERPEGFDVNAILDAVREVAGVRDAALRRTPAGAHSLRLDLADGADPAEVSRVVARLLQERMGLAAAPQNLPGAPATPPPPVRRRSAQPRADRPAEPRPADDRSGAARSGAQSPLAEDVSRPAWSVPQSRPAEEPAGAARPAEEPAGPRSVPQFRTVEEPPGPRSVPQFRAAEEPAVPQSLMAEEPPGPRSRTAEEPVGPRSGPNRPAENRSGEGRFAAPEARAPRLADAPPEGDEPPRRRRQASAHRGRAAVEESSLAAAPAGTATGSPATLGTSYSGGQMSTTETAPSRPLDTGGLPGPRVVIDHVQVSTFGLDATVEVRLLAGDRTAEGHSTGPAVDGYVLRLCAVAAAAAVDELLGRAPAGERGRCFVEHAAVVPFGNCEVATVVVLLVCDGWVEQLAGSALVAGDPRQAVVRATLAAVNRRLEALLA